MESMPQLPWIVVLMMSLLGAALLLWHRREISRLREQARQQQQSLLKGAEATRGLERAQAVEQERQRIYNDLHDDVGSKLLTLVHSAQTDQQADLARAVLQDLRDVVSRVSTGPCSLLQALAQIREEAEQRLEAMHSILLWQQDEQLPDPELDEAQSLHLFRISREAITNSLRHGHATQLRVRVRAVGQELILDYTDDGAGLTDAARAGRGSRSMRERAAELHGSIDWTAGTQGGTKVVLRFPLPSVRA